MTNHFETIIMEKTKKEKDPVTLTKEEILKIIKKEKERERRTNFFDPHLKGINPEFINKEESDRWQRIKKIKNQEEYNKVFEDYQKFKEEKLKNYRDILSKTKGEGYKFSEEDEHHIKFIFYLSKPIMEAQLKILKKQK